MLSGWSTAGKFACPYCMEKSKSFHLKNGCKHSWFDCHRQFLSSDHPYRKDTRSFSRNRGKETSKSPTNVTGTQLWNRVCQFPKITESGAELGKIDGRGTYHNWTKRSIFWDLPYWPTNLIRHNIDVMHNEKNVFDNVFNTVMDVKGKTKDNIKSRRDLEIYCNRPELCVQRVRDGKASIPKACYALTNDQKKLLLEWIKELRFPDGYVSNLARCVDLKELKMSGMKSHDCHVFMERLLPIALKEFLPSNVWSILTELSMFYRDLCAPKLSIKHMNKLNEDIPILLCKLEKIFPPSFFDVMEHLMIHLPYEALVGGPVQYRWMYPFERFLYRLKIKVKNKAHIEGSISSAYLVEEASTFFSYYFQPHVQTRHSSTTRNEEGVLEAKDVGGLSICNIPSRKVGKIQSRFLTDEEYKAANNYILLNCKEVQPYIKKFTTNLQVQSPSISQEEIDIRMENDFACWFRSYVTDSQNQVNNVCLRNLSWGPSRQVKSFHGIFVNGYRFHTSEHAEGKKTLNNGVCVKGCNDDATSTFDYYGILREIVELQLMGDLNQNIILFKCDWFDPTPNLGVRIHPQYKLIDINHKRRYPKYDPFVLAQQATQVYYASYPGSKRSHCDWFSVCKTKPRHVVEVLAYQEDVGDEDVMMITNEVHPIEDLTHESNEVQMVDIDENQIENLSVGVEDEMEDWTTDSETNEVDEDSLSDEDS